MKPIPFDNTYARDLDGFYAPQVPSTVEDPQLVVFNRPLAERLGLDADGLDSPAGAEVFSGKVVPEGATPLAQAYAGHQFGGFNPQLGDGRAVLLGEIVAPDGARFDIALKGSGRTPFSRGGDGKAALGPVLREYLMGEAMFALGIPTTRGLAAITTGERVFRDGGALPGAVLTRVASSHLRVGTFEFFAARQMTPMVALLVDYALARHAPELLDQPNRPLALLDFVISRQANLVAQWMGVGFIHGVMNTDNTTISGETIDFGPCALMEAYRPGAVFSSIDHGGRYAYANQPAIMHWNLTRLAEALIGVIAEDATVAVDQANEVLATFPSRYETAWLNVMRAKLGLIGRESDDAVDRELISDYLGLLESQKVDFTLGFRHLSDAAQLQALFTGPESLNAWLARWHDRGGPLTPARVKAMNDVNPIIIPRNHQVEAALDAAGAQGGTSDLALFNRLLTAVRSPYEMDPDDADLAAPAPESFTATHRTFCGT